MSLKPIFLYGELSGEYEKTSTFSEYNITKEYNHPEKHIRSKVKLSFEVEKLKWQLMFSKVRENGNIIDA